MYEDQTIEYALRLPGNSLQQCTMKAMKYDATMTWPTLLSIDAEGTPSTALGPKMGWRAQVYRAY